MRSLLILINYALSTIFPFQTENIGRDIDDFEVGPVDEVSMLENIRQSKSGQVFSFVFQPNTVRF
jgi:hypothetical protein